MPGARKQIQTKTASGRRSPKSEKAKETVPHPVQPSQVPLCPTIGERLLQDWKSEKLQKKELRASGVYPKLTAQEIRDLQFIFNLSDTEDLGKTTFQAFQVLVAERRGDPYDHYEEIIQGFHIIDCDNDGKITVGNLSHACQLAGLHFSRQELDAMVEEADRDGDHAVNLTEFTNVMLKTNLF
ncbi:calmodulin-like isoform X3 [Rhinatrema bivittatum]|uniref:calmodulin-like isoform X3 n=1 Tax=Rhinatrema bivittatum TaxID=194408 RepID=UPI001129A58B|nr:calmodulin-like isoform X3 [Rhinatrema bivittatum]